MSESIISLSSENVGNVAGSVATVMSRQIIKIANQNRATQFVVSFPLPKCPDASQSKEVQYSQNCDTPTIVRANIFRIFPRHRMT